MERRENARMPLKEFSSPKVLLLINNKVTPNAEQKGPELFPSQILLNILLGPILTEDPAEVGTHYCFRSLSSCISLRIFTDA